MSTETGLKLVPPHGDATDDGRIHLPFGLSYTSEELSRDLMAGLTVAAISLPQAMAYALLAGVDPRYGLYSAIVVTAIASIFGSSSHLINGPTSASPAIGLPTGRACTNRRESNSRIGVADG